MGLCDVIIPVYKSPEWLKMCIYSLIKNTDTKYLNKIFLINDCDDVITNNCLDNLKEKYGDVICILKNEENLGFVKSTNKGLKESQAEYVLLLNTDCIVAKNTIGKLINHMKKDKNIGLISPIASNAANISLPIYEGFTYMMMDQLLERKFNGISFDACTIVGNCLMISKSCIKKTGLLDEIYGAGYGEETDYQFKAMTKGFKAKIALDTYVFHKSEASFGKSKEKSDRLERNRDIFFERWGKLYYKEMEKYKKNDPISYINSNITEEDKKAVLKTILYLMGIVKNAGGVHVSIDMVNYLAINNIAINILYSFKTDYDEIMLFNPIQLDDIEKFEFESITSSIYYTAYYGKYISDKRNIPNIYFAQGYEPYFENGKNYAIAELSYKMTDSVLTISNYLKNIYKKLFNIESTAILNGIDYDLLHCKKEYNVKKIKVITIFLRGIVLKGDFILLDVLKRIINDLENIEINVICSGTEVFLPFNDNKSIKINKIIGPLNRSEVSNIMQGTDIYIDASLTEGFGLMALEGMAKGVVPVTSNSGGNGDYIIDGKNGFIIKEVNNASKYFDKIKLLIEDFDKYKQMSEEALKTAKAFDYDKTVEQYIKFYSKEFKRKNYILNEEEQQIYNKTMNIYFRNINNKFRKKLKKVANKVIPKKTRIFLRKIVGKVNEFLNDN